MQTLADSEKKKYDRCDDSHMGERRAESGTNCVTKLKVLWKFLATILNLRSRFFKLRQRVVTHFLCTIWS